MPNIKLEKSVQDAIGKHICERATLCRKDLQNDLEEVWKECSMAAKNQPIGGTVQLRGVPNLTYPLINPRVKALVKNVANPTTSLTPYNLVKRFGGTDPRYEYTEDAVQFLYELGNWRKAARKGVKAAAIADPATIRVQMVMDPETGNVCPEFTVIPAPNFIIYPVGERIENATVCGNVFTELRGDIQRKINEGIYYDVDISNAPTSQFLYDSKVREESAVGIQEDASGQSRVEDKLVVGDFVCRLNYEDIAENEGNDPDAELGTQYYLATVLVDANKLLSLEPFGVSRETTIETPFGGVETNTDYIPFPRPWYFEYSFTEAQEGEYFRESWFARELLDLQRAFNSLMTIHMGGTMMKAFPVGFAQGNSETMQNVVYEPGTIVFTPNPIQVQWVAVNYDQGDIEGILNQIQELADSTCNITSSATGQQFKADTTATAAQGYLQDQNASLEEYRENVASSCGPICEWLRLLGFLYYDHIAKAHPEFVAVCPDPAFLERKCVWEPNGKTGDNSPQTVMAKLTMIMDEAIRLGIPVQLIAPQLWEAFVDALDAPINKEILMSAMQQLIDPATGMFTPMPPPMPPGQEGSAPQGQQ